MTFEETIDGVAQILDDLFPADVTVIAEPGRYFCTAAYTLAVTIISRRDRFVCRNRYAFSPPSFRSLFSRGRLLRMTTYKPSSMISYDYTCNSASLNRFVCFTATLCSLAFLFSWSCLTSLCPLHHQAAEQALVRGS